MIESNKTFHAEFVLADMRQTPVYILDVYHGPVGTAYLFTDRLDQAKKFPDAGSCQEFKRVMSLASRFTVTGVIGPDRESEGTSSTLKLI